VAGQNSYKVFIISTRVNKRHLRVKEETRVINKVACMNTTKDHAESWFTTTQQVSLYKM